MANQKNTRGVSPCPARPAPKNVPGGSPNRKQMAHTRPATASDDQWGPPAGTTTTPGSPKIKKHVRGNPYPLHVFQNLIFFSNWGPRGLAFRSPCGPRGYQGWPQLCTSIPHSVAQSCPVHSTWDPFTWACAAPCAPSPAKGCPHGGLSCPYLH